MQRAGTLRYVGPPRPGPLLNRPLGDKCSNPGKPSQANRGPKNQGRSAEAFVKTFERDYVRITALPGADTALALIENRMEDYNTVHPHSRLGYRSPREYIA